MSQNTVYCTNCREAIDVNELAYHQLQDKIKKEFTSEFSNKFKELEENKLKYNEHLNKINSEKEELNKLKNNLSTEKKKYEEDLNNKLIADKKKYEEELNKQLEEKLNNQKYLIEKELRNKLKSEIEQENSDQIKLLNEELSTKSEQLKELNKTKALLSKIEREKDEMKELMEAEHQIKLNQKLKEEKERIQKEEANKNELKLGEKEHLISQLKKALEDAQRKAEQGSMQAQGEAQELAIEEYLKNTFPFDTIDEIKKGATGADCVQHVNDKTNLNCGTIYYESKRTKAFQPTWMEKFKADLRTMNADIGVIVTAAMPSDMDRMGLKDGIWICTFEEFKGLSLVLRESIINVNRAIASQENKGDKMSMLYDFLTSNEFRGQVEAIVEGFSQMKVDLDKEKRAIQSQWAKREKQIEKVLINTTNMYSSIRGIAGNAIQSVSHFELEE